MLTLVRQGRAQFANVLANRQRLLVGKAIPLRTQFNGNMTDVRRGAVFTTVAQETAIIAAAKEASTPPPPPTPQPPVVTTTGFTSIDNYAHLEARGTVVSDGYSAILARGFVYNTTGTPPTLSDTVITVAGTIGLFDEIFIPSSYQIVYLRAYATNALGTSYGATLTARPNICLAAGTMITLIDGSCKAIEEIGYSDHLLVWNFDEGHLDVARPLWIKRVETANSYNHLEFSDGSHLNTVGQHRIFNEEAGAFTYPMTDATPIGTTSMNELGKPVQLLRKWVVDEPIEYYNVITTFHMNMYANGILTSCRYNNIYPIAGMRFQKDGRPLTIADPRIQDPYLHGLRLSEQTIPIEDTLTYIERLETFRQ